MGFSHEAYVAYGVRVGVNPYHYDENGRSAGEQVDQALSVPTRTRPAGLSWPFGT
jgi:hypothetical protein